MRLHYAYYDANRRIGLTLPDGQQQSWGYDPAGRVNGVIQPGGGSWTVAHNGAGQPTMASVPSGGSQVWGYDNAGRAVSATWLQAGNPVFSQVATLDPAGQRKGLADSWGAVTYGYDRAGRLTSAGYPDGSAEADSYDPAGNRTAITATTPLSGTAVTTNTFDAADQLSTAVTAGGAQPGTTTYAYDGNGNQTGSSGPGGTTSNSFNDLNQLTHITGPGTNLTLLYDGQGDRLRSYERGTPTWTLRNEAQDLAGGLSALVSDGTADYAYLSPGDGSAPLSSYTPGTSRATYLGTDITQRVPGSVRLATDPSGATIGAGAYDAWGVARPYTGGSGATQLAGLQGVAPFGYAGQQRDAGPGTYAMRARRYDPATGRFQSQDSARPQPMRPITLDPYAYAWDAPAMRSDPSGLVPEYGFVCSRRSGFKLDSPVYLNIDGVLQGHDLAESAWLQTHGGDKRTCELQIPFGSRNFAQQFRQYNPYKGKPFDGYADVVENYDGGAGANLYEFEPVDAVVKQGSGLDSASIFEKMKEADHYVRAAQNWQAIGGCGRKDALYFDVRRPSHESELDPPGPTEGTKWSKPRSFVLGPTGAPSVGFPPIWRERNGLGTWYMVVNEAVRPGLVLFQVFKKDLDGEARPYYALDHAPATAQELKTYWAQRFGSLWYPGPQYNWGRPSGACGSGNCQWGWAAAGTAIKWVGVTALAVGATALTITAVGACVGAVVCGVAAAGIAIGVAVVLAGPSSPNYGTAKAAGVTLVRRLDLSGSDAPNPGSSTA